MDNDEPDLFPGWQDGDPIAFSALVRRWQGPIGRFLFHYVGQRELAQDLCQEVFLRAFMSASRYREQGEFSAWLYRITLNVARDLGRRRRPDLKPIAGSDIPCESSSPEVRCEQMETSELVSQAIAELPDHLREVLVLRHYGNMNFEQISRLLGIPASTLKSRFVVALNRLRDRLQILAPDNEESKK
jgi:RNA polymerase sigma-70 factor (ECF subfamily)